MDKQRQAIWEVVVHLAGLYARLVRLVGTDNNKDNIQAEIETTEKALLGMLKVLHENKEA